MGTKRERVSKRERQTALEDPKSYLIIWVLIKERLKVSLISWVHCECDYRVQVKVGTSRHYSYKLNWDTGATLMTCNQSRLMSRAVKSSNLSLGRLLDTRPFLSSTFPVSLSWFSALSPVVGTLAREFRLRSLMAWWKKGNYIHEHTHTHTESPVWLCCLIRGTLVEKLHQSTFDIFK